MDEEGKAPATDTAKKGRVLLVEDEKPLSHALQLKLQHEGFEVVTASNGQECVDLARSQQFDAVLLDIMMPVMDGFQVLQQLQGPKMPAVFVLSNLSQSEDEQRALKLGARKFFIKSNTPLVDIVEEIKKI